MKTASSTLTIQQVRSKGFLQALDRLGMVTKRLRSAIYANPNMAMNFAFALGRPIPEAEAAIATSASASLFYAVNNKKRFPAGEPAIATDPHTAYRYALQVVNDQWPAGEPAILAAGGRLAYDYATVVLELNPRDAKLWEKTKRWELTHPGETAPAFSIRDLLTHEASVKTASSALNPDMFGTTDYDHDLGVEVYAGGLIAALRHHGFETKAIVDAYKAVPPMLLDYIHYVRRARWPEVEPALQKDPKVWASYSEEFLGGPHVDGLRVSGDDLPEAITGLSIAQTLWLQRHPGQPFPSIPRNAAKTASSQLHPVSLNVLKAMHRVGYLSARIIKDAYTGNPEQALQLASQVTGPNPVVETIVAADGAIAGRYAFHILHGKFPAGEAAISTRFESAVYYAALVAKERMPAIEQHVAKILEDPTDFTEPDANLAFTYYGHLIAGLGDVRHRLRSPELWKEAREWAQGFLAGRTAKQASTDITPAIKSRKVLDALIQHNMVSKAMVHALAAHPGNACAYAKATGRPFPEGEPAIATNVWQSFRYAVDVLNGRFPAAEPLIAQAILDGGFLGSEAFDYFRAIIAPTEMPGATAHEKFKASQVWAKALLKAPRKRSSHHTASADLSPVHLSLDFWAMMARLGMDHGVRGYLASLSPQQLWAQINRMGYTSASSSSRVPWPDVENTLAADPDLAFDYMTMVLKDRPGHVTPWPAGEKAIASRADLALHYAAYLQGRFEVGEPAIARALLDPQNPERYEAWAYVRSQVLGAGHESFDVADPKVRAWAEGLLKHPHPKTAATGPLDPEIHLPTIVDLLGRYQMVSKPMEAAIATNGALAVAYIREHRGNQPWPLAEPAILRDPDAAGAYAIDVKKAPWPEAEPLLAQTPYLAVRYAKDCIHGRWEPGEAAIATSVDASLDYTIYVTHDSAPREVEEKILRMEPHRLFNPQQIPEYIDTVWRTHHGVPDYWKVNMWVLGYMLERLDYQINGPLEPWLFLAWAGDRDTRGGGDLITKYLKTNYPDMLRAKADPTERDRPDVPKLVDFCARRAREEGLTANFMSQFIPDANWVVDPKDWTFDVPAAAKAFFNKVGGGGAL